jgi:hypothetical protein
VRLELFDDKVWLMSLGARAAVLGALQALKPALAIEIGSMEGACLRHIAAHAAEVHSFDLEPPTLPVPDNVVLHTGDSHELLPEFLTQLAEQERNVDLVLVDGDHTPEGVRRDLEDLLDSAALSQTVVLVHDTANERVRAGVDGVRFAAWPKVVYVDADWIPGHLFAQPELRNELWYGLGLVIVDASRPAYMTGTVYEQRYEPSAPLLAEARDLRHTRESVAEAPAAPERERAALRRRLADLELRLSVARTDELQRQRQLLDLQARLGRAEGVITAIFGSASWKLTQPLLSAKRRVPARRRTSV